MLFFDIVTSVPHTTLSRIHGRREYPAQLLQVALLDSTGKLLFKSYVQPEALDWKETSEGTYLSTSHFKRKRYPTKEQLIEQIKSFLTGYEVVVYGLHEKWQFVNPFIHSIRQKWCSKIRSSNRAAVWAKPTEQTFKQALSDILFVPRSSTDNGLLDAESVAKGSRALWLYATDQSYRDEVEAKREYYLINPIVESIIEQERRPMYQEQARIRQRLEERIFQAAHIILPGYEREREARASANTICEALTGYSLSLWERYESWLDAPTIQWPYPPHLLPDYKIKPLRLMQPVLKVVNSAYPASGGPFTFLFDPAKYELGVDYVPIVEYPPKGTYSASALKKQFKLKEAQIKALQPTAITHGLWGEYFLYSWPIDHTE